LQTAPKIGIQTEPIRQLGKPVHKTGSCISEPIIVANSQPQKNPAGNEHQSSCPPTAQPDRPRFQFGSILAANSADSASFAGFADS